MQIQKEFFYIKTVIAGLSILLLFNKCSFNKDDIIQSQLKAAAETANKSCPMHIDSLTTMDNIVVLPDKIFQYNYTVKIDTIVTSVSNLKANLKSSILNAIKTNPSLQWFRDNKIKMFYSYSDDKGNFLFKLEYYPEDYKSQ